MAVTSAACQTLYSRENIRSVPDRPGFSAGCPKSPIASRPSFEDPRSLVPEFLWAFELGDRGPASPVQPSEKSFTMCPPSLFGKEGAI